MTEEKKKYEIVKGPSREELFDALRLRHEGRKVQITLKNDQGDEFGFRAKFYVNGIGIESGNGYEWKISLYHLNKLVIDVDEPADYQGHYNSKTRKGWLEPTC